MTDLVPDLEQSTRIDWLDRLRGLAIALMVLDHLLVVLDPGSPMRATLTRFALPLFMLVAADLWRPGLNVRRFAMMWLALGAEIVLFPIIGITLPGIMLGIIGVTILAWRCPRIVAQSWAVATVGFIGFIYLGWGAVAAAFAWWGLGRAARAHQIAPLGRRLPAVLGVVGRHPIAWYCGHLAVLALLVRSA